MENERWDLYAAEYHKHIISPFQEKVTNPLFDDLRRLKNPALTVADIGCGPGDLVPFLAERFGAVHAIDFSHNMIEVAKEKNAKYTNVSYAQADMRELASLGLSLDLAITVNSVLLPSLEDVDKSLQQIHASLKEGGMLLGIFPSVEAILYNFMLVYEREYAKYRDEKKALEITRRKGENRKYNLITGVYEESGEERQKFYYEFELRMRLQKAGFKNIRIKKVLYPWGEQSGGYDDFFGKDEMWDWYVTATK